MTRRGPIRHALHEAPYKAEVAMAVAVMVPVAVTVVASRWVADEAQKLLDGSSARPDTTGMTKNATTTLQATDARRRFRQDRKIQKAMKRFNDASHMANMYEQMLTVARNYGSEYEVERCTESINEWNGELDDACQELIGYGVGPEDMEN